MSVLNWVNQRDGRTDFKEYIRLCGHAECVNSFADHNIRIMSESDETGASQSTQPTDTKETAAQTLLTKATRSHDVRDPVYGWVIVLAAFMAHTLFFGINLSFGEIYIYLLDHFNRQRGETAWIGSISSGLVSLISPLAGFLTNKYGCRVVVMVGAVIAASGFIISSFVTSMDYLYVTYGVLVGCGLGFMFLPSRVIVNQYMTKRRALANGICSSGGGIGTIMISSMYRGLHEHFSLRGTFLVSGAIVLNAAVFGAVYRPRKRVRLKSPDKIEEKQATTKPTNCCRTFSEDYKVLLTQNAKFCIFVIANLSAAIGVFVPYAHLPRRARDVGLPEHEIAWILPLIGSTSVAGRIFFGWIGDFQSVNIVTLWSWSTVMCGASLLICPLMTSFPFMVVLSIIYGTFVGVWTGLKTVVVVDIVGIHNLSNALGIMMFLQGCAAFIGSPLAGWLYDLTGDYAASFYLSGGLFVCSGFTTILMYKIENIIRKTKTLSEADIT